MTKTMPNFVSFLACFLSASCLSIGVPEVHIIIFQNGFISAFCAAGALTVWQKTLEDDDRMPIPTRIMWVVGGSLVSVLLAQSITMGYDLQRHYSIVLNICLSITLVRFDKWVPLVQGKVLMALPSLLNQAMGLGVQMYQAKQAAKEKAAKEANFYTQEEKDELAELRKAALRSEANERGAQKRRDIHTRESQIKAQADKRQEEEEKC